MEIQTREKENTTKATLYKLHLFEYTNLNWERIILVTRKFK